MMGDGETAPQSPVFVPNIPELNLKFLRSAYDVKACVDSDSSFGWATLSYLSVVMRGSNDLIVRSVGIRNTHIFA